MQIMQIFQSKYDFVTSKRFNNKIKEYEKLGFVITNSVIDDCNLAYLDQVLLWLNPNRYLRYLDGYLLYFDDDATLKYCIKSNGAYQLFGKQQFFRPFAFIKDVLGFNDDEVILCVTSGVNISAFICYIYNIVPSNDVPWSQAYDISPVIFNIKK